MGRTSRRQQEAEAAAGAALKMWVVASRRLKRLQVTVAYCTRDAQADSSRRLKRLQVLVKSVGGRQQESEATTSDSGILCKGRASRRQQEAEAAGVAESKM